MLEHLFGSKTRVRLLRLFLQNQKEAFFVRELTRKIGAQINAVRNELDNLIELGLIEVVDGSARPDASLGSGEARVKMPKTQKKYYRLNTESLLCPELRALFMKSRVLLEKDFVQRLAQTGSVSYLVMTGQFVGLEQAPTDLLVVGRLNRDRIASLIRSFEREVGREINFTVMTPQEYKYRRDVTDRFLYSILESKKIVVIDTISERIGAAAI
jgi:hypothetical protein